MHWFMAAGTLGLFGTVQVRVATTGCTVSRARCVWLCELLDVHSRRRGRSTQAAMQTKVRNPLRWHTYCDAHAHR